MTTASFAQGRNGVVVVRTTAHDRHKRDIGNGDRAAAAAVLLLLLLLLLFVVGY